jgi:isoleucyl-tRNA synthetase
VVVLDARIDDELKRLGLVREIANRVQNARKEAKLELSDRITLEVTCPKELVEAIEAHRASLSEDVLAVSLVASESSGTGSADHVEATEVEGMAVEIRLRKHV